MSVEIPNFQLETIRRPLEEPVIFVRAGNKRSIVEREFVKERADEGTAKYIGHEKVHRNPRGYFLIAANGRCASCGSDCRDKRLSVAKSVLPARGTASFNRMRVKGSSHKGKKKDFDKSNVREIGMSTSQINHEMRELNEMLNRSNGAGMFADFTDVDAMIRLFELEEKTVGIARGEDGVRLLCNERQKSFAEFLAWIEQNDWYQHPDTARFVTKLREFLFPHGHDSLKPFQNFLNEFEAIGNPHGTAACEEYGRGMKEYGRKISKLREVVKLRETEN